VTKQVQEEGLRTQPREDLLACEIAKPTAKGEQRADAVVGRRWHDLPVRFLTHRRTNHHVPNCMEKRLQGCRLSRKADT
jgi:hypothetical protein